MRWSFMILLVLVAGVMLTVLPAAADSWDLVSQLTTASNPNGQWSYGCSTSTVKPATTTDFTNYDTRSSTTPWSWSSSTNSGAKVSLGAVTYVPAGGCGLFAFGTGSVETARSIARWTAPSSGAYSLSGFFKNNCAWHINQCQLVLNQNQFLSKVIFTGDTTATWKSWPISQVLTLNAGDTIDFVARAGTYAYQPGDAVQVAATIKTGSYVVNGSVRDAYGNGLGGAKVAIVGTDNYVITNASGNFTMALFEGSYTFHATLSPYTSSADQSVTVTGAGTFTVPAITMTTSGPWNLLTDHSVFSSVNGNWSYGTSTTTANTTGFVAYPNLWWWGYASAYYGYKGFSDAAVPDVYLSGAPAGAWQAKTYNEAPMKYYTTSNGTATSQTVSIVRWTAPTSGYYSWTGWFKNSNSSNHKNKYTVFVNKTQIRTSGYLNGGDPQANLSDWASLAAGDTLDFETAAADADPAGNIMTADVTVTTGAPGFAGYVEDAAHNRLAGATVTAVTGTETFNATTGTDGTYTMITHAGTFDVTAKKQGYENQSATGLVITSNLVTQNFTLPSGVIISGHVTRDIPPAYPVVAGAGVYNSDGTYSTLTDSAGYYSLQVTRGTYSMNYAKAGYAPVTVSINAASNVTQDTRLGIGWDFATDFSTGSGNPNGAWSYGSSTSTAAYTTTMFTSMTASAYYGVNPNYDDLWYFSTPVTPTWPGTDGPGFNRPAFLRNFMYYPQTNYDPANPTYGGILYYGGPVYREARKVVAMPSGYKDKYAIARFTAPTSGFFHIAARFAGSTHTSPYTKAKVALVHQGNYVFGGPDSPKQIDGFVGRAVNGYSDSAGTGTPVYTYAFDADLSMGDRLDAVVLNDVAWTDNGGWGRPGGFVQVDLTISRGSTALAGRVTSALPDNLPIPGATVVVNGNDDPWPTYQTLTDAAGYYVMSVRPGNYNIEFRAPGYNTSPDGLTVTVPADSVTTYDYTLSHSGTWNLGSDFSVLGNPGGQWSYGTVWTTTPTNPRVFEFTPFTSCTAIAGTGWIPSWNGSVPHQPNAWTCWVAKNTTGAPAAWHYIGGDTYVEKDHMTFGGGDTWYVGGPAIRWTSPDERAINIDLTLAGQRVTGGLQKLSVFKNLSKTATRTVDGFIGRASANYTDSVGPAPVSTWNTSIAVTTGDTLEFALGNALLDAFTPWEPSGASFDIWLTISTATNVNTASTIAQVKALGQGQTVILTVPQQLACATIGARSFDKAWGNPTPGSGFCFYVQSDDRTQGLKCLTDGTIPTYSSAYKVTFTGTVDTQLGEKVVRIQSINSAALNVDARPLGKVAKSATKTGTLVKVWGKIIQMVANTGGDNSKWDCEYIIINDGSGDIKIPMHVQTNWMSRIDSIMSNLAVGHYIAVTGISGTTSGTDAVVYPRDVYDIYDYTAMSR